MESKTYFKFIISNIVNFFKILSKTIVDGLNDVYNFKVKEKYYKQFNYKRGLRLNSSVVNFFWFLHKRNQ